MDQRTRPAARLAPLPPEHTPELKEQFEAARKRMGFVPNSLLIMQRNPDLVKGYTAMSAAIWNPHSKVDLKLKRLISHVSSRSAGCQYCMAHTAEGASKLGVEDEKLHAVWDYQTSPLFTPAERAALDVAVAAANVPNAVTEEMFTELRKHWTEEQISAPRIRDRARGQCELSRARGRVLSRHLQGRCHDDASLVAHCS